MTSFSRFLLGSSALLSLACQPQTPRPGAGQTCFALTGVDHAGFCDSSACFQKDYSAVDSQALGGDGFRCDQAPCKVPGPGQTSPGNGQVVLQEYVYIATGTSHTLELWFDNRILLGYSLAAFQTYLESASATIATDAGLLEASGSAEILDYQGGLLHLRFVGDAPSASNTLSTIPYPCLSSHTAIPTLCSSETCDYVAQTLGGTGDPVHVTLEVTVPIEQPQP